MLSLIVKPNDSPYNGKDGDKFGYSHLKERLIKEAENDVSLRVEFSEKNAIQIFGRGDLHLGILIEKMRREGYEMSLTPPQVIYKQDKKNNKLEPIEILTVEFEEKYVDFLIEMLQSRYGEITHSTNLAEKRVRVEIEIPTRGMFGIRSKLIAVTKGNVIIQTKVKGYEKYRGPIKRNVKGAIICMIKGKCTSYALNDAESHGELYVKAGDDVYEGQVIGELDKEGGEVELSPCREKHVTNVRTTSKEENIKLKAVRSFTIEDLLVMLRSDELLEVTPKYLRIRKIVLNSGMRRKLRREKKIDDGEN